jgi:uncharacterized protein (TIGR03067 family)
MYPSLLTALALAVAAPGPKERPRKVADPLLGAWAVQTTVEGGRPLPLPAGGQAVEFRPDGRAVLRDGARPPEEAGYASDPKKDPPEIDITPPPAGGHVVAMSGIYKVEGDTLTVCVSPAAAGRPTKFESPAGQPVILMTFKRAKKKE